MKIGYIYRIFCNTTGLQYYGSTYTERLSKRLYEHRGHNKLYKDGRHHYMTSYKVLENDNYKIVLVEAVSTDNRQELHRRELFYIESNKCVNKCLPTRTIKEWRVDNKESICDNAKKYYTDNKEHFQIYRDNNKEHSQNYRDNNREKKKQYNKIYNAANKEARSKYNKKYRDDRKKKSDSPVHLTDLH